MGVELLRLRVAVHRVEDPAAVIDHRLQDVLERGVIRARRMVREGESDHRELLAGRRNRALDERAARLLQGADELRRECERRAGAGGHSQKFPTVDHASLPRALLPLKRDLLRALRTLLLQHGTGHLSLAVDQEIEEGSSRVLEARL